MMKPFKADVPFSNYVGYPQQIKGRAYIYLWDRSTNKRRLISYARYVFSVIRGVEPPKEMDVDHIDNDKTNDCLSNLQLLPQIENIKKSPQKRTSIHGSLARYRYCKCALCLLGKKIHNKEGTQKYHEFLAKITQPV